MWGDKPHRLSPVTLSTVRLQNRHVRLLSLIKYEFFIKKKKKRRKYFDIIGKKLTLIIRKRRKIELSKILLLKFVKTIFNIKKIKKSCLNRPSTQKKIFEWLKFNHKGLFSRFKSFLISGRGSQPLRRVGNTWYKNYVTIYYYYYF